MSGRLGATPAAAGGPLTGVIVVDLTQQLAGPGGTMLLGDMGADVIRVDPPPERAMADNMVGPLPGETGRRRVDLVVGRSKRSISLDLTQAEARQIVYDLARRADVVAQNYRPGVAEKLGMDADSFRRVNPDLIYSRISVYGDRGPDSFRVGFDIIAQAGAGTMTAHGDAPPTPQAVPLADVTGFCLETIGILAALYHRKATGQAQSVSTSMLAGALLENILRMVAVENIDREWRLATVQGAKDMIEGGATFSDVLVATATGIGGQPVVVSQRDAGNPLGGLAGIYYGVHRTRDGYVVVGALNLRQQRRLNEALRLGDPRFEPGATPESIGSPESMKRFEAMPAIAEEAFKSRSTDEMLKHLEAHDIACGPVRNTLELFDVEHHLAEEVVIEMDDPTQGPLRTLGYPIRFERTPMRVSRPAPPVGGNSDEILAWLGYHPERIADLRQRNVVY